VILLIIVVIVIGMVLELRVVALVAIVISRPQHPESIHVLMNLPMQYSNTPPRRRGRTTIPLFRGGGAAGLHTYVYLMYIYVYLNMSKGMHV
jgi:hypothetical protein